MARPLPRLPPVTIATRPSNFISPASSAVSTNSNVRRRPNLSKAPPEFLDARLIRPRQCRVPIGQVELFQRHPRTERRFSCDRPGTLENVLAISSLVHGCRDGQRLARLHEVVVF